MGILLLQAMWRPLPRCRHHAQSQSCFPTVVKSPLFRRTSSIRLFVPVSPRPIDTGKLLISKAAITGKGLFFFFFYSEAGRCASVSNSWIFNCLFSVSHVIHLSTAAIPDMFHIYHCSLWAWHWTDTPLSKEIKKRFMTGPVDIATWKHQQSYSRFRFLHQLCNHWLYHQPNLELNFRKILI